MALSTGGSLLLLASMAAAGGQIAGGVAANDSAKRQAKLEEEQAQIALDEANVAAEQKATQRRKFLAEQRMAYLANGVNLTGTPGIVQADTFKEFQMEIDALRRSGVAQFKYGMSSAANTRATGRAQLLSGILSGVGTALQAGYSASGLGVAKGTNLGSGTTSHGVKVPSRYVPPR